jgi:hypothetical protein
VQWNDDLDGLLLAFYERGMTARAIADAMSVLEGCEISRNAVRARLRRLGTERRPQRGRGVANFRPTHA